MGTTGLNIRQAAQRVLADYDEGRANEIFAERGVDWLTFEEAYALQMEVAVLRMNRGEQCLGYKIGCVSPTIQKQFGLEEPVFGRVWKSELLPSGSVLALKGAGPSGSRFVNFAIEGEIGVRLAKDISPAMDDDSLSMSVECWFPVIELHNYVFRAPAPTSQELIAGNAMHAGFVANPFLALPFRKLGKKAEIEIRINGQRMEAKSVSEIPKGPLGSIRWLASSLARRHEILKAGEIVLTGSPGKLIPINGHKHIVVACEPQRVELIVENKE